MYLNVFVLLYIFGSIASMISICGYYQCISVIFLFCITHQVQLGKTTIYVSNKKLKNLAAHYVSPVSPNGITLANICVINMGKLKT